MVSTGFDSDESDHSPLYYIPFFLHTMSLLQGVLRSHTTDALDKRLSNVSISQQIHPNQEKDDSDDELVNVVRPRPSVRSFCVSHFVFQVSVPGTPARSRPSSRPQSPTRRAVGRLAPGPLHLGGSRKVSNDPLKVFPTDLSQKIFNRLSITDLARCAQVSRKWSNSQTLNYGLCDRQCLCITGL